MPFAVELSTEIAHRYDFALLANARGYRDAVEVGTDLGVFARDFLSRFAGNWLVCVDPYEPYAERPGDRSLDALIAVSALMPYHGRFRFVRAPSPGCVAWVRTFCSPDFVYVDGAHREEDVTADIEAWWDALPPDRGILAGHDWDAAHPGVISSVTRFARDRGLVVRLTGEKTGSPSWYVYRKEPETLVHLFFRQGESVNPHAAGGR